MLSKVNFSVKNYSLNENFIPASLISSELGSLCNAEYRKIDGYLANRPTSLTVSFIDLQMVMLRY